MADFNPYQAPSAHVEDVNENEDSELAERATRLGAVLVDGLIFLVPALMAFFPIMTISKLGSGNELGVGAMISVSLGLLGILAIIIIDLLMLHRTGQTIGKRLLKVKIIRTDGSRAGLTRIFFLRMFVPGLIGGIPIVGMIFAIADPLLIFQESRRCIHDLIADTIVVQA